MKVDSVCLPVQKDQVTPLKETSGLVLELFGLSSFCQMTKRLTAPARHHNPHQLDPVKDQHLVVLVRVVLYPVDFHLGKTMIECIHLILTQYQKLDG